MLILRSHTSDAARSTILKGTVAPHSDTVPALLVPEPVRPPEQAAQVSVDAAVSLAELASADAAEQRPDAPPEPLPARAPDPAGALDPNLLTDFPNAKKLLDWLKRKSLTEVTKKMIMQRGPTVLRNAASARAALLELTQCGWLITNDESQYRVAPAAVAALGRQHGPC